MRVDGHPRIAQLPSCAISFCLAECGFSSPVTLLMYCALFRARVIIIGMEQLHGPTEKTAMEKLEEAVVDRKDEISRVVNEGTDMVEGNQEMDRLAKKASRSNEARYDGQKYFRNKLHEGDVNLVYKELRELGSKVDDQKLDVEKIAAQIEAAESLFTGSVDRSAIEAAKTELVNKRSVLADLEGQLDESRGSASRKMDEIHARWSNFSREQAAAAEDPIAFAAENILKAREFSQDGDDSAPAKAEIAKADFEKGMRTELGERLADRTEKYEADLEAVVVKEFTEAKESLTAAKDEVCVELDGKIAFLSSETPEGKEFMDNFNQYKEDLEVLSGKTFFFNKEKRQRENKEAQSRIHENINATKARFETDFKELYKEKFIPSLELAWHGKELKIFPPSQFKDDVKVPVNFMKEDLSLYFSNEDRIKNIANMREGLRKLGHDLQRELEAKNRQIKDLLK